MKDSNGLWHLGISALLCCSIGVVMNQQSCPPPDVPAEGSYFNKQNKFLAGDKVVFTCKANFTLLGKEIRTCQSTGDWTDRTPFCVRPAKMNNPRVTSGFLPALSSIIDSNINTCYTWDKKDGDTLQVYTNEKVEVDAVRMFLEKGAIKIRIASGLSNTKVCADFERYLGRSQWVLIKCQTNDILTDSIKITKTADSPVNITICEIEIYGKDEYGCEQPPTMRVSKGFFEVSRNKATLHCEDGFTAINQRLVCEGNAWKNTGPRCDENLCEPLLYNYTLDPGTDWVFLDSVRKLSPGTRRQLKCSSGYKKVGGPEKVICLKSGLWSKTNATCIEEKPKTSTRSIVVGVVGAVVALIILILLGITIYLVRKQRNREVVVVFKPSGDGSMTSGNESEYATAYYETIQSSVPIPPTTSRPSPLPPALNDGYIMPEGYKRTLKKQQIMPTDIAFGALKQSTLYGS